MATPKPWEQEWKVVEESDDEVETVDGACVIAKTYGATEARADRAVFIAAAPAMARALLRVLGVCANTGSRARGCIEDNIKYPCQACEAKAALKAAGVLP
jgi:hypothetical protein